MLSHVFVLALSVSFVLALLPEPGILPDQAELTSTSPNLGRRQRVRYSTCVERGLPACGSTVNCISSGYICCPGVGSYIGYGCLPTQNCWPSGGRPGCCPKGRSCSGYGGGVIYEWDSSTTSTSYTSSTSTYRTRTSRTTYSTRTSITTPTYTTESTSISTFSSISTSTSVSSLTITAPITGTATPASADNSAIPTSTLTVSAASVAPSLAAGVAHGSQRGAGVVAAVLGYAVALML